MPPCFAAHAADVFDLHAKGVRPHFKVLDVAATVSAHANGQSAAIQPVQLRGALEKVEFLVHGQRFELADGQLALVNLLHLGALSIYNTLLMQGAAVRRKQTIVAWWRLVHEANLIALPVQIRFLFVGQRKAPAKHG